MPKRSLIASYFHGPAIRASAWAVIGPVISQALRLAGNLILTRLLAPEYFGLMALVSIVMQGVTMMSDVGLRGSIVRSSRGEDPGFVNTAWSLQIGKGIFEFLGLCLIAYPIAAFYEDARFLVVIPIAATSAICAGFNSTALILANRKLWLGRVTLLTVCAQIIGLSVMISWALISPTVWALVAGGIVNTFVTAILSHRLFPFWKNRLAFDRDAFIEILAFGKWIFLSSLLTFFASQLDRIVLGKLVPLDIVGVYSLGFMLSQVPYLLMGNWAGMVFYPVASQHFRENNLSFEAVLAMRRRANWLLAASILGLFALAPVIIDFLYLPIWSEAASILRITLFGVWFKALDFTYGRINMAFDKPVFLAVGSTFSIILFAVVVIPLFQLFGIQGIAAAWAVSQCGSLIATAFGARALGQSDFRHDFFVSALMLLSIWAYSEIVTY